MSNVVPIAGGILDRNREALNEQPDKQRLTQYVLDETDPRLGSMRCNLFTLVHVSGDHDAIQSWLVPKGASDEERNHWAQRIGSEADEWARNTASTCPYKQSFRLTATIGTNPTDHPKGGYPFVATPPPDKAKGFAESSGRDARGGLDANSVVGNLSRTIDNFTQTFSETVLGVIDRQSQEIAEARVDRIKHMEHIEKMWKEREELRDTQAERQAKLEQSTMWSEAQRDALQVGMKVVRDGVDKFMESYGLSALVKTLKAEQVAVLFHSASQHPEQKKAMAPLVNGIMRGLPPAERDKVCDMMGWKSPEQLAREAQLQMQTATQASAQARTQAVAPQPQPQPQAETSEASAAAASALVVEVAKVVEVAEAVTEVPDLDPPAPIPVPDGYAASDATPPPPSPARPAPTTNRRKSAKKSRKK